MAIFKPFKHEMDMFMTHNAGGRQKPNPRRRPSGPIHLSTSTTTSTGTRTRTRTRTSTSTSTRTKIGTGSTHSTSRTLEHSTDEGRIASPTLLNITPIASTYAEAEAEAEEAGTLSEPVERQSKNLGWESLGPLSAIKPTVLARPQVGIGLVTDEARGLCVYEYGYGWVTGTVTGDEDSNGMGTRVMAQQQESDVADLRQRLRRSHHQERKDDAGDESDFDDTWRIVHLRGLLLSLQQPQFVASLGTSMSRKELAMLFAWMSARDLERSVTPSTATQDTISRNAPGGCRSGILKTANINQGRCLGSVKASNVQSKKVRWGSNTTVQLEPQEEEPVKRTGLRIRSTRQPVMHDLIEFD